MEEIRNNCAYLEILYQACIRLRIPQKSVAKLCKLISD